MINDLEPPGVNVIKFIDDTTFIETVQNGERSEMPAAVQYLEHWSLNNSMIVHPKKTKEILTCFSRKLPVVEELTISDQSIETVESAKLLGVTVSDDLTWEKHILTILKKANSKVYYLVMLKRFGAPIPHMLKVYNSHIRSVLEYACQVWHPGLNKGQSDMLESIQERALKIIFSKSEYTNNLEAAKMTTLKNRRLKLCKTLFSQIQNVNHKLHHLLPETKSVEYKMRSVYKYEPPKLRTLRARGSFVNWALYNLQ